MRICLLDRNTRSLVETFSILENLYKRKTRLIKRLQIKPLSKITEQVKSHLRWETQNGSEGHTCVKSSQCFRIVSKVYHRSSKLVTWPLFYMCNLGFNKNLKYFSPKFTKLEFVSSHVPLFTWMWGDETAQHVENVVDSEIRQASVGTPTWTAS